MMRRDSLNLYFEYMLREFFETKIHRENLARCQIHTIIPKGECVDLVPFLVREVVLQLDVATVLARHSIRRPR